MESLLNSCAYDVIVCSHVLEHLRDPAELVALLTSHLAPDGHILIAVPNVLNYRTRYSFIRGHFRYEDAGILDKTHLRFFTYFTADTLLLKKASGLELVRKFVTGSVPLWLLRRYILPYKLVQCIDKLGCSLYPNLFGDQVIIHARKRAIHQEG